MKSRILSIICFAASILAAASCSQKMPVGDINLSFEVYNPVNNEVVLVYDREIYPVTLDNTGKGTYTIKGKSFLYTKVFYGQEAVNAYFEAGDNVTVSFDGSNFNGTFAVSGDKANAVRYLNTIEYTPLADEDYALELEDYKTKLAAKETSALKLLENSDAAGLKNFVYNERNRIKYSYGTFRIMYSVGHMIMAQLEDWKPEKAYYDYVAELAVENSRLTDLEEYRNYIIEASAMLKAMGEKRDFYSKTLDQMEYLSDNIKDVRLREVLMFQTMAAYVDQVGTSNLGDLANLFKTYVKDEALVAAYEQKCAKWDFSAPGRISPDFKATDIKGNTYSLKDFRGKLVYIDLWATWCGPCRREIPFMKKLEEKYKGKEIYFVSLSTDKDKAAWEKRMAEGDLAGIQLYLGNESKFLEAYRVDGIPRFILLDKDGRIIDNNMTRPSADETAARLDSLLK